MLSAGAQSLSVSGSPTLFRILTAGAGLAPDDAVSTTTTYSVRAQKKNKPLKVTGRLNAAMPAGMSLKIEMAPSTGATGLGPVSLDATARDLVGNITNTTLQTRSITYTLSAAPSAGVVARQSRTVTLTLTSWP